MTTRTLTDHEHQILAQPQTMKDMLPIVFDSGFKVTGFASKCGQCSAEISEDKMKADVVSIIPTLMTITTIGECSACDVLTVTKHRIRSDQGGNSLEYKDEVGNWRVSMFKQRGLLAWIRRLIGL